MYKPGGLDNMEWEDVTDYDDKCYQRDHTNDSNVSNWCQLTGMVTGPITHFPPLPHVPYVPQTNRMYLDKKALLRECKKQAYNYQNMDIFLMFTRCFPNKVDRLVGR